MARHRRHSLKNDTAANALMRYLAAAALCCALLTGACGRSRALAEEGLMRMAEGKQTSALELFDRALKSNASEPLALYGKGMLLSEEQITENIAVAMLKQAVTESNLREKLKAMAYLRLAEIYALRSERDEAMQNLDKISGTARLIDSQGVRRVAGVYLKLKEKDRAREALTAYLETHNNDEEAEYYLLKLYSIHLKDLKSAGKICAKVDWQKSRIPGYLLNCSKILAVLNDYTTALSLIDLHLKRTGQGAPKEVHELRDAINRKRVKADFAEADF